MHAANVWLDPSVALLIVDIGIWINNVCNIRDKEGKFDELGTAT